MSYYLDAPTEEEAKGFYRHVIRKAGETRWVFRFRNVGRQEQMILNDLNTPHKEKE